MQRAPREMMRAPRRDMGMRFGKTTRRPDRQSARYCPSLAQFEHDSRLAFVIRRLARPNDRRRTLGHEAGPCMTRSACPRPPRRRTTSRMMQFAIDRASHECHSTAFRNQRECHLLIAKIASMCRMACAKRDRFHSRLHFAKGETAKNDAIAQHFAGCGGKNCVVLHFACQQKR